jgi:hypothetical protein
MHSKFAIMQAESIDGAVGFSSRGTVFRRVHRLFVIIPTFAVAYVCRKSMPVT